uniref:cDNA sequence U90926 n=1 Tax=Nannospalax galili TaxID=1026970 RepID=A0A8C6RIA8_NANGA
MKAMILVAFLVLTAHCVPARRRFQLRIVPYCPFLNFQQCQRAYEMLSNCRKLMNRRTTPVPSFPPTIEIGPPLIGSSPAPLTPSARGDIRS